jgi:hypothetical protein
MRRAAVLALMVAASACASIQLDTEGPVLLRFPPPARGGPTVFPEASPSGVLDLSGPCVRLQLSPGRTAILISSHKASVGRDAEGRYFQYDGRRFRHGEWIKGGGGGYDQLPADPLDGPVPEACRSGPFLVLVTIAPFDPSKVPPPQSPPPPPIG